MKHLYIKQTRVAKRASLLLAALSVCLPLALSQEVEEEDVLELSPFTVDGSKDKGYRAENTLAGSRMNMSLEDVAQSVSVLTEEFLEDVGAEDIEDILRYALNSEEYLQEDNGFSSADQVGSMTQFVPNGRSNIRGGAASVTVDYNQGGGSIDTYNTSRVEISQGPNAIMFGFGGAGGLINLSTQRANTQRSSLKIQSTVSSYEGFRNIFNANVPLIEGRVGLRVISLVDQADNWRAGVNKDHRRNTFVMSIKPLDGTNLNLSYENGHMDNQFTVKQAATDNYTAWAAVLGTEEYEDLFGDGTYSQFNSNRGSGSVNLDANGLNRGNNARRKVFIDNLDFEALGLDESVVGNIVSFRNMPTTDALITNRMFSGDEIDIAAYTPFGADAFRNENVKNKKISLSQRITPDMYLSLEYFDSENWADTFAPGTRSMNVRADPMEVWDGVTNGTVFDNIDNPFAPADETFYLYSEDDLNRTTTWFNSESYRATWAYRLKTERLGTHQFRAGWSMKERSRINIGDEQIIDVHSAHEQGVDLGDFDMNLEPNNSRNRIFRRHYYAVGEDGLPMDDSEVSFGDLTEPAYIQLENGDGESVLVGTAWAPRSSGTRRGMYNNTNGQTFSMTNRLLNNRLVTTFGIRNTDVENNVYDGVRANSAVVLDEDGNPTYDENGQLALTDEAAREFIYWNPVDDELGADDESYYYMPSIPNDFRERTTENSTIGAVYKLGKKASIVYNRSDNRADQDFFRLIIPGVVAPNSDGTGEDIGLRFNLMQNKMSVRINYFKNAENNARMTAGIGEVILEPQRAIWDAFTDIQADAGIVEGDPRYVSDEELTGRRAEDVNQTLFDKTSSGYDVRVVGNLTDNWNLVFNLSDTLSFSRENLYDEDLVWVGEQEADARALYDLYVAADDGSADLFYDELRAAEEDLGEFFLPESDRLIYDGLIEAGDIDGAGEFLAGINPVDRVYAYIDQETSVRKTEVEDIGTGVSKLKASLVTSYTFREGGVKGLTLGGGFTWRDSRILNRFFNYTDEDGEPFTVNRPLAEYGEWDSTTDYESGDDFRLNLMASYKTKLRLPGNRKADVKFQLNVKNVLQKEYETEPLRYLSSGEIRKYQIIGPRTWRFSTTLEF